MVMPKIGMVPFQVECKFTTMTGQTIIRHDLPEAGFTATPLEYDGCDDPGCYVKNIQGRVFKALIKNNYYLIFAIWISIMVSLFIGKVLREGVA